MSGADVLERGLLIVGKSLPASSGMLTDDFSPWDGAMVTAVFAGLSCWLLVAARDGSDDLGLVERLTAGVQSLFPLVVALGLRQTARDVRVRV